MAHHQRYHDLLLSCLSSRNRAHRLLAPIKSQTLYNTRIVYRYSLPFGGDRLQALRTNKTASLLQSFAADVMVPIIQPAMLADFHFVNGLMGR